MALPTKSTNLGEQGISLWFGKQPLCLQVYIP